MAERTRGALAVEFQVVLSDVALGRMRREALHDLGKRTGVDDLVSFAAAIIQADQTGISIGKVLRIQSDQIRTNRRQKVEEAAAVLGVSARTVADDWAYAKAWLHREVERLGDG